MNTHPKNALKILKLLLHCGMICQEELNVVLEMMPGVPDRQTLAAGNAGGKRQPAAPDRV